MVSLANRVIPARFTGASPMGTPFNAESSSPSKHSDFTVIVGCVFLSILITGSILMTTRLIRIDWLELAGQITLRELHPELPERAA